MCKDCAVALRGLVLMCSLPYVTPSAFADAGLSALKVQFFVGFLRHRKWYGLLDGGIGGAAAGTAHRHVAL